MEVWSLDSEDGILTLSLGASSASVVYRSWEIWTSNRGGSRIENDTTGPAIGAVVSLSVTEDAILSETVATTDTAGGVGINVIGGSVDAVLTAGVTYATKSAAACITIPFLDSDEDGYSNAAEIEAGTDPNDAASNPGTERYEEHERSGTCMESGVILEEYQVVSCTVSYTDSEGLERQGSVSVDLGKGPRLELADHLGTTSEHIINVEDDYDWVRVEPSTDLPTIGIRAHQFVPPTLLGAIFDSYIVNPKDNEALVDHDDGVPTVVGNYRMTAWFKKWEWTAKWKVKLQN